MIWNPADFDFFFKNNNKVVNTTFKDLFEIKDPFYIILYIYTFSV